MHDHATAMAAPFPPVQSGDEPLFRLSIGQYQELIDAHIIDSDEAVELLEGLLVKKMTKYPPHVYCVMMLRLKLEAILSAEYHFRSQDPIVLADGQPEPDGAVVQGVMVDYAYRNPIANEVRLVIEVADSSLKRDRGIKLRSYARAGIAEYWIINLIDRQVEVYADPDPTTTEPCYRQMRAWNEAESVPFAIAGLQADLLVRDLLPPT